ncbi:MAG TPA: 30S ribosomal protein S12 methylthiotransferase RimO, partial [Methylophilaceae bacterium]|nr:30S ribosomal protein S12 methylthiotransferase RimO [Methylophilaceae bacterium]
DGAAANQLANPVAEELKQERLARFMQVQEAISAEKLRQKIGRIEMVLVDEVNGNEAIGRTSADAPDIDGVVYLSGADGLQPGDLVEAQIVNADGHDLWASPPDRDF